MRRAEFAALAVAADACVHQRRRPRPRTHPTRLVSLAFQNPTPCFDCRHAARRSWARWKQDLIDGVQYDCDHPSARPCRGFVGAESLATFEKLWATSSQIWRTLSEVGLPGMSAIAAAAGLTAEEVSYVLGLAQSSPLILRRAGIDVGESYRVCFLFFNHGAASPAVGSDHDGGGTETGLSYWIRVSCPTAFQVLSTGRYPLLAAEHAEASRSSSSSALMSSPTWSSGGGQRVRLEGGAPLCLQASSPIEAGSLISAMMEGRTTLLEGYRREIRLRFVSQECELPVELPQKLQKFAGLFNKDGGLRFGMVESCRIE